MLHNSTAVQTFLTPQRVERLMELDIVVAIKDSSLDLRQINDLVRFCGDEIQVFIGLEDLLLSALSVGAVGAVAMMPQVVGRMAVELYETAVSGDMQRARELHDKMVRVYDLFNVGSGYVAIKEAMNMLGRPGRPLQAADAAVHRGAAGAGPRHMRGRRAPRPQPGLVRVDEHPGEEENE